MRGVFKFMAQVPWPFLFILPAAYIILTAIGWTQDDIVEDEVANIWIAQEGDYHKDKKYWEGLTDTYGLTGASVFAAVAASRDGGNIFNADRLEEIRTRMEEAEATTIEYNGNTYTWDDICSSNNAGLGTSYQFPCARISPMDLFQEARWFFDETDKLTWYRSIIKDVLVRPRIPRFGIMQEYCTSLGSQSTGSQCDLVMYNRRDDPIKLFSDIGDLEYNDPCKICIEEEFEKTMQFLTQAFKGMFGLLTQQLASSAQLGNADAAALVPKVKAIYDSMNRKAVEEMYLYYVTRGLYGTLGKGAYTESYGRFMAIPPDQTSGMGEICDGVHAALGLPVPCARTVTEEEADEALKNQADNVFSSVTTAGNPFPFWSSGDGNGVLFAGTSPVGGSGIDMSGTFLSSSAYLDLQNAQDLENWSPLFEIGKMDPASPAYIGYVESDPVYRWFMASQTPMTSFCNNGDLTGTLTGDQFVDATTNFVMASISEAWCTTYNLPFEEAGTETQQHFAKMWYDLLIDSPAFLGIRQGESDPYVWTTGAGCDYDLKGVRYPYTNESKADILSNASRELYYIDEGVSLGALDRNFLIGNPTPRVGEYDYDNPLEKVESIQSIYLALFPKEIVERVKSCNRPGGQLDITESDATEILYRWKEAFENSWARGWDDDNAGAVQFVGFFDDRGNAVGSTGRMLDEMTLSSGTLMTVSFVIIAAFSVAFLFSFDPVESRVLLTLVGVAIVILSFFAALGLAILAGIKINVTIGWTLPFIMIGLGVDDMYIVIMALKRRKGYSIDDFADTMKSIIIPVTMTSLVNAAMFAIINISDVPAVYLTGQAAVIAVVFLWLTIVFCFPAYCYLDMKRQEAGRCDVLVCKKVDTDHEAREIAEIHNTTGIIFRYFYEPLMLKEGTLRTITHVVIFLATLGLVGISIWGVTETEVGLGLEDFFPEDNQASAWALRRTNDLASWSIGMNWNALDYSDPTTQMKMTKQFENVLTSRFVADVETKSLWIANLAIWTSRHCDSNFARDDPDVMECGRNIEYEDEGFCSGTWKRNTLELRTKIFSEDGESCVPREGGVCRPTSMMHPADIAELGIDPVGDKDASWCPVFEGWSDEKLGYCVQQWRKFTGGAGRLFTEPDSATPYEGCDGEYYNDGKVITPIPFSVSPTMNAYNLFTHEDTVDMIEETRAYCDDDEEISCWMSGIPFDYWEQYIYVEEVLIQLIVAAVAVGFVVAAVFLFFTIRHKRQGYSTGRIAAGSLAGALLISVNTALTVFCVVGLSSLADVSLTAFSDMSYVLSVGFAVEYSVHIVHRFITAPMSIKNSSARLAYCMNFLFLPTFMSFVSSTIGVVTLAFTDFEFNTVFFFRPLIILMFVSYFFGCYVLPLLLSFLDFDFMKLGKVDVAAKEIDIDDDAADNVPESAENKEEPEAAIDKAGNETGENDAEEGTGKDAELEDDTDAKPENKE